MPHRRVSKDEQDPVQAVKTLINSSVFIIKQIRFQLIAGGVRMPAERSTELCEDQAIVDMEEFKAYRLGLLKLCISKSDGIRRVVSCLFHARYDETTKLRN